MSDTDANEEEHPAFRYDLECTIMHPGPDRSYRLWRYDLSLKRRSIKMTRSFETHEQACSFALQVMAVGTIGYCDVFRRDAATGYNPNRMGGISWSPGPGPRAFRRQFAEWRKAREVTE